MRRFNLVKLHDTFHFELVDSQGQVVLFGSDFPKRQQCIRIIDSVGSSIMNDRGYKVMHIEDGYYLQLSSFNGKVIGYTPVVIGEYSEERVKKMISAIYKAGFGCDTIDVVVDDAPADYNDFRMHILGVEQN